MHKQIEHELNAIAALLSEVAAKAEDVDQAGMILECEERLTTIAEILKRVHIIELKKP